MADGIVIYSAPKDWLGKPVSVGERVMLIADPNNKKLDIELPVNDAINVSPGTRVKFYLNVDPLNPLDAKLRYVSYSAEETPGGDLAYHLKADFLKDQKIPRIGLKGTAKVYGERVSLFYYLFWRPIAWLRQTLGI